MSLIVRKWRKVVSGCNIKNHRESLIENDFLAPRVTSEEFVFERKRNPVDSTDTNYSNRVQNHVYNDYDNLKHGNPAFKSSGSKPKNQLKDTTNVSHSRGLKRFFSGKPSEKEDDKDQENLTKKCDFLCDEFENIEIPRTACVMQEGQYCEILEVSSIFSDNHPLIELNKEEFRKTRLTDSKSNLFIKTENDEQQESTNEAQFEEENLVKQMIVTVKRDDCQNLTDLRPVDTFSSRSDAIGWYLRLLCDRMSESVRLERKLTSRPDELEKRLNVIAAHLLYSRNFYEMRTRHSATMSVEARAQLDRMHPCVVALACLCDSDAVRIVDSHGCACDSYMYLFATRVKFCAWKTKLFVILKRPKQSSFERLNLIEDLMNCRRLMAH